MTNSKYRSFWKYLFVFLFIAGTGCMLVLMWRQNDLLKEINRDGYDCLVQLGFCSNGAAEYMNRQEEYGNEKVGIGEGVPVLKYFVKYQKEIEVNSDGHIDDLVQLYPGKHSKNIFWSGAASEARINQYYYDEQELKSESDTLEAAAIAENENLREKEQMQKEEENISQNRRMITNERVKENLNKIKRLESTGSLSYLLKNFYIVDSSTSIDKKVFEVDSLLNSNLSIKKKREPQILIFHTHAASESFRDSQPGKKEESIVGVGSILAKILEDKYGYQVIHDETEYDRINGKIDRNKAYNKAFIGIQNYLEKYPSIEVIIDLHRDGVGDSVRRITNINGKKTAQVMFFNGLSRNNKGNISYLKNKNLQSNLAFSLQLKMKSMELYSDFTKPVYLKGYRYNLHFRKRSLLIELGNQNNTLQDAKNAMDPLAKVLNQVLSEK